ncbi:MAG: hypothetical protein RMX65_023030 [Nostoc sp. DedQUE01]
MKKIPMLTNFNLPWLPSARVTQLSTTQLVERSDALSLSKCRNQRLW